MRVGINARLLYAPTLRGFNRYTVNLIRGLRDLGIEFYLYLDRDCHPSHKEQLTVGGISFFQSEPMNYFEWEQWWLPRQCDRHRISVLHCPFNFGLPMWSGCPRVLTLHDAIDHVYYMERTAFFRSFRPDVLKSRFLAWASRTCADHVITVSSHARNDLVFRLGLESERISVTYEAADSRFQACVPNCDRARVMRELKLQQPYVFYCGGWERRKKVSFLLRAFAKCSLKGVTLVLGGGLAAEITATRPLVEQLGIADRVRLLGWLRDEDLPALYAQALCFVYPSEYEGFGLQAVEAMSCACPVLAARASALPEIVGTGGQTFGLVNVDELVAQLTMMASDAQHRQQWSQRGLQRAAQFSWHRTALETHRVYSRVISE